MLQDDSTIEEHWKAHPVSQTKEREIKKIFKQHIDPGFLVLY